MPGRSFQTLLEMADRAISAFTLASKTYNEIKDTLSTHEQSQLNDKLKLIHSTNMALSAELDAALANIT